ncbi:MAG: Ig-like domain-containing protein [Acidobacteria bacterium]|nr:Ig-like domain-containing protein [Acidobacteriota bacterium]
MFKTIAQATTIAQANAGALLVVVLLAGCDRAQLLAPTSSTITVSTPTRVLPLGGSTEITAFVLEQAGTPVQNGTTVRFTTTLGRVDPVETQTRNGLAVTNFFAGNSSGVAQVRASSGAATGGDDATNVVDITVGSAAVNTVTLRANPGSVGPSGGTVGLVATVVAENGRALSNVAVTFNTDHGTLSAASAATDENGEARTTLTTSQKASVTATAGAKTSSAVVVDLRVGPAVSIACAPASGSGNCAAVQASTANNTATVLFTVTKPSGSSTLRSAVIEFGDGSSDPLGILSGSPATATSTHTYNGPSDANPRTYLAIARVTDINGEVALASTTVIVTPRATRPPLGVTLAAELGTAVVGIGRPVTLTATVTPTTDGSDVVQKYEWTFGDDTKAETNGNKVTHVYTTNGLKTAAVKVTTVDGRSATATVDFIISIPEV